MENVSIEVDHYVLLNDCCLSVHKIDNVRFLRELNLDVRQAFDLMTKVDCGKTCPGDCIVSRI